MHNNKTKISIITVCLNPGKTIEKTIKSVLGLSYPNVEYIVIDGGSENETLGIIKKNSKSIDRIVSENDSGIYDAMNKGIHFATGDLIGFLNAGDWYEDVMENVAECFEKTNADVLYGDVDYVINGEFIKHSYKGLNLDEYYIGNPICHQAIFTRASILKARMFDTRYKILADYEYYLHLFESQHSFVYVDEKVANFSWGGVSNNSKFKSIRQEEKLRIQNSYYSNKNGLERLNKNGYLYYYGRFLLKKDNRQELLEIATKKIIEYCRLNDIRVIWGLGKIGKTIIDYSGWKPDYIIDSSAKDVVSMYKGINVYEPDYLKRNACGKILISVAGWENEREILEFLQKNRIKSTTILYRRLVGEFEMEMEMEMA